MPLINEPSNPPTPPNPQIPTNVVLTSPDYRHSVVDSKVIPENQLLTYLAGSQFIVDYYSQVIGSDEEVSPFQPNQEGAYQQYTRVRNFEMKLQNPFTVNYSTDLIIPEVTGEAIVYPSLVPNKGDAFIGDIGDGRAGQFTITEVQPLSVMKQQAFRVTFSLSRLATEDIVAVIDSRVVKSGYFVRDYLMYGENPIIADEKLAMLDKLQNALDDLTAWWFKKFLSAEFRCFLVPGQLYPTYDHFVAKAMFAMLGSQTDAIGNARILNMDAAPQFKVTSVWDAIVNVDPKIIYGAFRQAQMFPITAIAVHPQTFSVRYSGIGYAMAPTELQQSVGVDYDNLKVSSTMPLQSLQDGDQVAANTSFISTLASYKSVDAVALPEDGAFSNSVRLLYSDRAGADGYVFSQAFYDDDTVNMPKIDLLVYQFLKYRQVTPEVLVSFCDVVKTWGRLEQFYYIPALLAMVISTIRKG